jgi:predicted DCC family thiol-disulfide oxidoreductase YuxK
MPVDKLSTFVLVENNKAYPKSTAALKIARNLSGGWPLMYAFIILPPFIRDVVYNIISRYRYKWFGKRDECMIPTPELRARFLE